MVGDCCPLSVAVPFPVVLIKKLTDRIGDALRFPAFPVPGGPRQVSGQQMPNPLRDLTSRHVTSRQVTVTFVTGQNQQPYACSMTATESGQQNLTDGCAAELGTDAETNAIIRKFREWIFANNSQTLIWGIRVRVRVRAHCQSGNGRNPDRQ